MISNSVPFTNRFPVIQSIPTIVSPFSPQVVSWCGTLESGTVLDVTGSVVVVSFTTDRSDTYSGFNISMEFVNSSKWDSFQRMFIQYMIILII